MDSCSRPSQGGVGTRVECHTQPCPRGQPPDSFSRDAETASPALTQQPARAEPHNRGDPAQKGRRLGASCHGHRHRARRSPLAEGACRGSLGRAASGPQHRPRGSPRPSRTRFRWGDHSKFSIRIKMSVSPSPPNSIQKASEEVLSGPSGPKASPSDGLSGDRQWSRSSGKTFSGRGGPPHLPGLTCMSPSSHVPQTGLTHALPSTWPLLFFQAQGRCPSSRKPS